MSHLSQARQGRRWLRQLSLVALTLGLTLIASCADKSAGPNSPGAGTENFGIQVVNASGVRVTVRINGPQFAQQSVTVVSFGNKPIEVNASIGDEITFEADGSGFPTGSGGCAAGADAVNGYPDIYAQVNILPPLTVGGPLQVICSSGWQ